MVGWGLVCGVWLVLAVVGGVWVGFGWYGGCLGYGLVFGLGFLISVLVVSSWFGFGGVC